LLTAAGIACDCEVESISLPATIEAVLASAVREGVTNVIRHSRAKHCTIRVTQDGQNAGVVVLDDGNGRQGTGTLHIAGTSGSGLRGLAERVAVYHGSFSAGAQDGGGFRLAVTLPLKGMGAVRVEAAHPDSAAVRENAGR
jgi:two-component system sensor histidine kinase DesK